MRMKKEDLGASQVLALARMLAVRLRQSPGRVVVIKHVKGTLETKEWWQFIHQGKLRTNCLKLISSFLLLMCITNIHCDERTSTLWKKSNWKKKRGSGDLIGKHWTYDQQFLHRITNLHFAFQAGKKSVRFTDYHVDPKTSVTVVTKRSSLQLPVLPILTSLQYQ